MAANVKVNTQKKDIDDSSKEKVKNNKLNKSNKALYSIFAIIIGILIGIILLMITGNSFSQYFSELFNNSLGSLSAFGDTLGSLAWIIPLGLCMVVSFRIGVFNIGSAGQMLFSGFIAYLFALEIGDTFGAYGIIFIAMTAIVAGALVAWFIGILKTKLGVNEVISSILINWIVFLFIVWSQTNINSMIDGTGFTHYDTSLSLRTNWLSSAFNDSIYVNAGIFVSIPLLIIFGIIYSKTKFGFKQDVIGNNANVANYIGINKKRQYLKAMILSGALAGVAGWIYIFGTQDSFPKQTGEISGDMYQGITIALIGFNTYTGTLFASFFVSIFMTGGGFADSSVSGLPMTDIILATIILIMAITHFFIIYRPQDKWFAPSPKSKEMSKYKEDVIKNKEEETKPIIESKEDSTQNKDDSESSSTNSKKDKKKKKKKSKNKAEEDEE
ncbi:MAG: sugar ABC transporter permease [Candidatus Tyloplasma litorale]|nr:MAG: sugar ABC transporter permease [Mycoplasmatales bacterium]